MRVQLRKHRTLALDIRRKCVMNTTKEKVIDMNEDVLILIGWCMIAAGIVGLIIMEVI